MDSWAEMEEQILKELNLHRMKDDAEVFSRLERYSGSEAGEAAVDYLVQELEAAGIEHERHYYELMRSLPVQASVTVKKSGEPDFTVEAIAAVYSGEAHGLTGELVWDEMCTKGQLNGMEQEERFRTFKGKIVLTYDISFPFYYEAARAGALGIVAIWPKDIHHHDTMGGVWGMPGSRDRDLYPYLPYVQILGQDGLKLIEMVKAGTAAVGTEAAKGMAVTAQMDVAMDNRIVRSSMPVATIPGKSESFVLLSGHYDSWYEGMTDNGAANVLMLETARALEKFKDRLNRTVVIAWWSGHSDARYSGSTWYYDHHWEDLKENCVAHINMDICGCKGSDVVGMRTSMLEGEAFDREFLREFNDKEPEAPTPMVRFADQTFWGADIPFAMMPQFIKQDHKIFSWWHTKEDTFDKVDPEVTLRDTRVIAKLTAIFANCEKLPAEMSGFVSFMENELRSIEQKLSAEFDLSPVWRAIGSLKEAVADLENAMENQKHTDDVIMEIAGELARIMYTTSSPYHQDPAVKGTVFAGLAMAEGLTRENTEADYYLAVQTRFVRQRNRLTGQMNVVAENCRKWISGWGK